MSIQKQSNKKNETPENKLGMVGRSPTMPGMYNRNFRKTIAPEYIKNVNNKTISKEFGISQSTVERIIHERFQLKIKEALHYPAPLMMGIDEHTMPDMTSHYPH